MTLLRRTAPCLLLALLAGAPALPAAASSGPATVAAAGSTTRTAGGAVVVRDPRAARARVRALAAGGAVVAQRRAATAEDRLVLRLRTDASPRVVVSVDGRPVTTLHVRSRTWRSYAVRGSWRAGEHTVRVAVVRTAGGRLQVDRLGFAAPAAGGPEPAPAPASAPAALPVEGVAPYAARVADLVDDERRRAGLRGLRVSSCATGYAGAWSRHMAGTGSFAHRPDLRVLLGACRASSAAENIARTDGGPEQLVEMWMASAGHRATVLDDRATHLGVGVARTGSGHTYATLNLLRLR